MKKSDDMTALYVSPISQPCQSALSPKPHSSTPAKSNNARILRGTYGVIVLTTGRTMAWSTDILSW